MKKLFSVMLLISLSVSFVSCKNQNDPQPQPQLLTLAERAGTYTGLVCRIWVETNGKITLPPPYWEKHFDPNTTQTRFDIDKNVHIVFNGPNTLIYTVPSFSETCTK